MDENTQNQLQLIDIRNRLDVLEKSAIRLTEIESRVNPLLNEQSLVKTQLNAINAVLGKLSDAITKLNQPKEEKSKTTGLLALLLNLVKRK